MDCFGTYFTRAQTCDNVRGQSATQWTASVYFTHAQTCDNVRVQSSTQWTASVHTLHMLKPVITFVFKVLRKGLLRTYFTHAQTCDNVRVQSATQWTASVHTLHMPKPVFPYKGTYLDCAYFWDLWPPWTRLHILASILKLYAMASFSGMCTHGRCYAVFTWLNLPVRSRVHVRHQYVCPCADMVDATPFQTQKRSYAINIFAHVQTWSMLRHVHLIEQWKLLFNNENCKCQDAQKKLEKVVKSQMLAMFIFYCKLHMKVLTTEKCDVALAWEKPSKVTFFKKPMRFYNFCHFFVKKWTALKTVLEWFMTKWWFLQYICCVHRND